MKKHKSATIIIIIVIVAAVIFFMMAKVADVASSMLTERENAHIQQLSDEVNAFDYSVYWIGTPPEGLQELMGDNLIILSGDDVNISTMPYSDSFVNVEYVNENGVYVEHHQRWEYSGKLLIVINSSEQLSPEAMEIVRECVVNNDVPLLLIGDVHIADFRSMMFMSLGQYNQNSTMLYSTLYDNDIVTLDEEMVAAGGQKYVEAFLQFAVDIFSLPEPDPEVIYQPIATDITDATEIIESSYELEDGIEE